MSTTQLLGTSSEVPQVGIADLNKDILHLIFEIFDLQPGSPTATWTRKDLLSAAKACKAFAGPALDSLWRVLPSLLPLLLLLPSAEVVNNEYFVDNLSSSNSWERFEIHARRVRTLYLETNRVVISPIIYLRIRSLRDNLLPGLKAIYIPDNTPKDSFSSIFLLSEASLEVVELNRSAISARNFFIPFMSSLASKSPKLAHLALRGTENVSLEHVYCLTNLQRLEIRLSGVYLYPQTVRGLGDLVNLLDLTLDVGASTTAPDIGQRLPIFSPSSSRNFGKLKRLHIIGTPSSITRVLDDINIASLTNLVIDETPNTIGYTESFWKRCFDQVSVCQAIEDIEINQLKNRSWGHDHYSLSTSWFYSIFNLNNLRSLVINGSALSGSDEDFRLLACAFPKLERLIVPSASYSQGRTLACLFHFSRHCPNLCEIKICIGFDIYKNLEAIKMLPRPISANQRHPLKKLYIKSHFDEMQPFSELQPARLLQVAQFLDLLFPHLSVLKTYRDDSSQTKNSNWTAIRKISLALKDSWNHQK